MYIDLIMFIYIKLWPNTAKDVVWFFLKHLW